MESRYYQPWPARLKTDPPRQETYHRPRESRLVLLIRQRYRTHPRFPLKEQHTLESLVKGQSTSTLDQSTEISTLNKPQRNSSAPHLKQAASQTPTTST